MTTLITLVSFNGANGAGPSGDLIADANGNLFGTTSGDGANNDGTVFEIAKTATGYASTPTTLVSFNGANGRAPEGSLIADANGAARRARRSTRSPTWSAAGRARRPRGAAPDLDQRRVEGVGGPPDRPIRPVRTIRSSRRPPNCDRPLSNPEASSLRHP